MPRVDIVDERGLSTHDKYYKAGSTIELKCVISNVPQPTSYVTWKHGDQMLNYDTRRGGIRLVILSVILSHAAMRNGLSVGWWVGVSLPSGAYLACNC